MTKPSISSKTQRRGPVRNRPAPMALEQRLMFDAAGVADAAAAVTDHATDGAAGRVPAAAHTDAPADLPVVAPAVAPVLLPPIAADRHELVFIVDNVGSAAALAAAVPTGAEVHLLDGHGDALAQMAGLLAGRQDLDAIHLISHGSTGRIELGTVALDSANLAGHQAELQAIGASLRAGGDLLVYGCNVGADGLLVDELARITQADIAASTDTTGAAALGGDWTLEAVAGSLQTNVLAFSGYEHLLAPPPSGLYTFAGATSAGDGTFTTSDGFFSLSRLDGNGGAHPLNADQFGAFIEDLSAVGSATTSYIQVGVKTGGSFQVTDAVIGDYNASNSSTDNNFTNVYAVGYAGGTQVAITNSASSVGVYSTDLNLNFSAFSGVAIDAFRVYYTWSSGTTYQSAFNFESMTITAASTTPADSTPPTVTGVSASTANGTYKVGDVIAVQVNFSENVTVTGTPRLTLETGSTDRAVNYSSGSGSSTLTFNYTVQAGDTSADLDVLGTSALALNGGTIKDAAGNNATLTLASPGAANSLGANKNIVVDGVVPTVSGVSSSIANGSYKAGDVVAVQVGFSEAVTVTGTPQLTLETGSTDRVVNYSSGSGSSTLTFSYTVQAGDTSADLDVQSTSALALNGGTVRDAAGNNATLTLASPGAANSLGANKALVIDTTAPAFVSAATNLVGTEITLTYNDTLSATTAAASRFSVVSNSQANTVLGATVSGSTVTLSLQRSIRTGQAVTVAYADPSAGDDGAAVQDSVGNDAASLAATAVTNNTRANVSFGLAYRLYDNGVALGTGGGYSPRDIAVNDGSAPLQAGTAITGTIRFIAGGIYSTGTGSFQLQGNDLQGDLVFANGTTLTGSIAYHDRDAGGAGDASSSDSEMFLFIVPGTGEAYALITDGNSVGTNATDGNKTLKSGDAYLTTETNIGVSADKNSLISNLNSYLTEQVAAASAPVLDLDASAGGSGYATGFTEGGAGVAIVDTDVSLSDADSANLASATVVLTNAMSGDSLSVGTLPAGITASTNTGTPGQITVTLSGSASPADYQTALRAISFSNSSGTPDTTARTVTVQASDGSNSSNLATTTVSVTAVNSLPVLAGLNGDSASFTEGGSAVGLDAGGNATVSDTDSADFAGGTLTAAIVTNHSTGEDLLAVRHQGSGAGQIGVSGSTISYGGTAIGSFTGGSGSNDLVVTFNSSATPAAAQALVRALTYANSNTSEPSTAQRTVRITLTDGDGGTSTAADVAVAVVPVNDAPTLSATGGTPSFTENGSAVDLFSGVAIGTVESGQTIDRLTLTVANLANGGDELLSIDGSSVALTHGNTATTSGNGLSVTVSVAGSTATVTVAKAAGISAATAQTVVDGLAWRNTSDTPGTTARTITLTSLRDNGGTANGGVDSTALAVAATVSVVAVNDAPTISASASIGVTEDLPSALTGLGFSDVDAAGGSVTARFSAPTGMLGASSGGGVTAAGGGTGTLTLTGSIADINSFIAAGNLAYVTAANATANVTLTVAIDDGGNTGTDPGLSGTSSSEAASTTVTLAVGAVNDAPVNTVPGTQTLLQDGSLVFGSGNGNAISVADIDAGGGSIRITLGASHGLLSLSGTSGLSFLVGSGTGDATMTLEGTQADINTALAGLSYTPTAGYTGNDQISLVTSDLGLSGSGGAQTDADTIALTITPANPVVTTLHSASADGRYSIGSTVVLTVGFDQAVLVDTTGGMPTLLLETGSNDRSAAYVSGSGTATLSFSYTVQEGDLSPDLDTTSTAALSLGGGTIRGLTGSNAVLTLPAVGGGNAIAGQHAVVVDGVRPTASIVVADTALAVGETSLVTITFSEAVTGFGNADLALDHGTLSTVSSSDGGITWTATFTPDAGVEDSSNLITLANTGVADAAGNTGSGTTASNNHAVDTLRPTVTLASSASALRAGQTATISISLSEAATDFGAADISVSGGTLSGFSGSGTSYSASFTPNAGSTTTATLHVDSNRLSDAAGNANGDGLDADNHLAIAIDTVLPGVTAGQQFSYAENRAAGALIGTVASDDPAGVDAFEIIGGNAAGHFAIDASGRITLTVAGAAALSPANDHETSPNDFSLAVRARDAAGNWSAPVDVQLHLTDLNDNAPVAAADTAGTPEDTPVSVSVLANDSDADGDALGIRSASVPAAQGTVAVVGNQLVFTPAPDFNGTATITYTATDGTRDSAPATLTVSVAAVDDASVMAPDVQTIDEDGVATGNVLGNDSDVDDLLQVAGFQVAGSAQTHSAGQTAVLPGIGALSVAADGSYSFAPAADWNGSVPAITYTTNTGSSSTLTLQVSAVADPASVSSPVVNEASPWAVFSVGGVAGETLQLQLDGGTAGAGGTDFGTVGPGNLQVSTDGGATWQPYDGQITLPAGGTLLARTPVIDDGLRDNGETFSLTATPAGGVAATGTATIRDDGTGSLFGADGQVDAGALPSDDRTVGISSPVVNEASPWAVFSVSGSAGQRLALRLAGASAGADGTDFGAPGAANLEISTDGGATWHAVDSLVTLPDSGSLLARTPVIDDGLRDNGETFNLTAKPAGGLAATGTATIRDDGTGSLFGANGQVDAEAQPSDDRTVSITNPVVNEASPFAVFTVSGSAGQRLALQLAGASAGADGTDFGAPGATNLEISTDGGATWQAVDSLVTLPDSGNLLARTPVIDDGLRDNGETFTLAATPAGGTAATGTATLRDDGSGNVFGADGAVDANALPSDDRPVDISSPQVNEASPWAVFTVTGHAGQRLALALDGGSASLGDDVGTALEYFDGTQWQAVNGLVTLTGDTLLVRVVVHDDGRFEGAEQFVLRATPPGGPTAAGTATLRDDGTGTVFDDAGQAVAAAADDDRPRPAAELPAAAPAPAPAPAPVVLAPPALPAPALAWLPPVIDPGSPVSGGEVHTLTIGERTPDQFFGLNSNVRFALPLGLFNASRPAEQLTLAAEMSDGRPLPAWLSFNPNTRTFEGKPPAGARGELQIKISARDASGNQADALFRLQIGETEDPTAAPAPAPAAAPAADPRQPVRKTGGRISLQQQLKDLAPPRRTAAAPGPVSRG